LQAGVTFVGAIVGVTINCRNIDGFASVGFLGHKILDRKT
jgi:hypothetical protein